MTVSWIRHRDIHLLTVGKYTYTSDQRFRAIHEEDSDDWILKINYAQTRDTGVYECQVSTTPPISHFVKLKVVRECFIQTVYDSHPVTESTTSSTPPPQFDPSHSRDVTALAGQTAVLNCRVHNIKNMTVSWIRHRDIHLLTVGKYTYTSDQRFRAIHEEDSDDWILKINYAQTRDTGVYECQVSTTPPISHFVKLKVVQPLTKILGGPDIHINRGSTINLTCIVQYSPEPPDFIYWNHNDKIISYDSDRGGVTVIIEKGDVTTSSLLIQNAAASDSGQYDCNPSNTEGANITVHVLSGGEHPAAMQHGGQSTYSSSCRRVVIFFLMLLLFLRQEAYL